MTFLLSLTDLGSLIGNYIGAQVSAYAVSQGTSEVHQYVSSNPFSVVLLVVGIIVIAASAFIALAAKPVAAVGASVGIIILLIGILLFVGIIP